ncbi:hypothetical protein SeMB42_g03990 [Synchytrium endobioticum]|uniref:Uncharacterized protein n=1 Tax=Synchytrium endobioticum TaxID=286115 RepID=A0A507CYU5_9FUNG|nr:hypothetical protein SeLEV6574_g04562 [Synchytrium endobioticum]TPX45479.1 hypothetical protein SeMB42_g03990 [Synchytrium endobioticum]
MRRDEANSRYEFGSDTLSMMSPTPVMVQSSAPSIIIPVPQPSSRRPNPFSNQFVNLPSVASLEDGTSRLLSSPTTPGIDSPSWINLNSVLKPVTLRVYMKNADATSRGSRRSKKSVANRTETDMTLLCRPLSPSISTHNDNHLNIREFIHCRDIKLIACMGDSLLTGLCMADEDAANSHIKSFKSQVLKFIGYRRVLLPLLPWLLSGESRPKTCISGAQIPSVGRLIQHQNPALVGLSYHNTFMMSKGGMDESFNFAQSGATIDKLPGQISRFLKRLKRCDKQVVNGWKLMFVWIGANDCVLKYDLSSFEHRLVSCIQRIKQSTTKTIVSVISLPDLSCIQVYSRKSSSHTTQKIAAIKQRIARNRQFINSVLQNVTHQYDWGDGSDFRICLQPVPVSSSDFIPSEKLISAYDHVHPNALAHQIFAKAIWLNLFRGDKEKLSSLDQVVLTPWVTGGNEEEYIRC